MSDMFESLRRLCVGRTYTIGDTDMEQIPSFFMKETRTWFAETLGEPTPVQTQAWPHIHAGEHTLVSAPTGTGKTLTAFLVCLDQMLRESSEGTLSEGLQVIYVSPLKSLAADIRENLKCPLDGISGKQEQIRVAIRTGDTTQKERHAMIKKPPHILITTPESLYLLLTSTSGRRMLETARSVIIDELHAVIDTKRGAHLMLSLARLDVLCGRSLQRIGLSATIEPLSVAAEYLSPDQVSIVAPAMTKKVAIEISAPRRDESVIEKDSVWRDIAAGIYEECRKSRSAITFVEGRKAAEQLAHYMGELGGEDFARVHHGSLSREQRGIVEQDLKQGRIRLLIATSSMELGIDMGEIDQVFQVGLPRTISSTMQRLGRAGHSPNQTSVMQIYPRTAQEALYCGMTAEVARRGGVEYSRPPRMCLDILAQHLVSMAANRAYEVSEVLPILKRAKPFCDVTAEDVRGVLRMLAGDYEHESNVPVRPRLLYDRIHDRVEGDNYSRMLAVAAGGTIPDRGMFTVRTESGVKVGEVEEEFVFECRVGDEFQLGSFHWRVQKITNDTMYVIPSASKRDRLPFWKGDIAGRKLMTGLSFGELLRHLEQAYHGECLEQELSRLGLDEECTKEAAEYLERQIQATEILPSDRTIIAEHYQDGDGNDQLMIHSVFGNRVNAPLALLLQETAAQQMQDTINYVSDDDGIVLFPYDGRRLPEGLLYRLNAGTAKRLLETMVMGTPTFNIMFRYNAGRALMMGMSRLKRQPLWIQRIKGAQMLERAITCEDHPLIRETRRECLEDYWDLEGVIRVLTGISTGAIQVRELFSEIPSPMSFLLRKKTEESQMYNYAPTPNNVIRIVEDRLQADQKLLQGQENLIAPDADQLRRVQERRRLPEDEQQLHTLLMIEGDLTAGELAMINRASEDLATEGDAAENLASKEQCSSTELPVMWLEHLLEGGQVNYISPGLWIAAEQEADYDRALVQGDSSAREKMVLRLIRYRGEHSAEEVAQRYLWTVSESEELLEALTKQDQLIAYEGAYFHRELFERARRATVRSRRELIQTQDFTGYASLLLQDMRIAAPPSEQLAYAVEQLCGQAFPMELWESVIFPARVSGYRPELLDSLLSQGDYYWKLDGQGMLCFCRYEEADWDAKVTEERSGEPQSEQRPGGQIQTGVQSEQRQGGQVQAEALSEREQAICSVLKQRGACFVNRISQAMQGDSVYQELLSLAEKGIVCADSFGPVRYLQNRDAIEKRVLRQQVQAKVKFLSAGRWDFARSPGQVPMEHRVEQALHSRGILCKETAKGMIPWTEALEVLRIWEYIDKVRRGYFVKGLSGIQFIRHEDVQRVIEALRSPVHECRWISAIDPAQAWGKLTPHMEGRAFLNVAGTCVAIYEGRVIAVFERSGRVLRVFEEQYLSEALAQFARDYEKKCIFTDKKRIVVKEYPEGTAELLHQNGFQKEMQNYVLYR